MASGDGETSRLSPATAAQETVRLTERQEWGSPPSQDVLCRHDASHPAFLSQPYHSRLREAHAELHFQTKDEHGGTFEGRFGLFLQQQVNCFLDFKPSLTLLTNPLNLQNGVNGAGHDLYSAFPRKCLNFTAKGHM